MASRSVELPTAANGPVVHLLAGPYVTWAGRHIDVPEGSQRLLAYVALASGPVGRRHVAGTLWPSCTSARAAGNLRSALWRLRACCAELVQGAGTKLALRPDAEVDVDLVRAWAEGVIEAGPHEPATTPPVWQLQTLDLLPDWGDDWAVFERERLRQLVLHALETLVRQLTALGRFAEAVTTALMTIRQDPLRETAQRALIEAYVSENNMTVARRAYAEYARVLHRELGVQPDPALRALVG